MSQVACAAWSPDAGVAPKRTPSAIPQSSRLHRPRPRRDTPFSIVSRDVARASGDPALCGSSHRPRSRCRGAARPERAARPPFRIPSTLLSARCRGARIAGFDVVDQPPVRRSIACPTVRRGRRVRRPGARTWLTVAHSRLSKLMHASADECSYVCRLVVGRRTPAVDLFRWLRRPVTCARLSPLPHVLLLEVPTTDLDPRAPRSSSRPHPRDLRQRGSTILLTTST